MRKLIVLLALIASACGGHGTVVQDCSNEPAVKARLQYAHVLCSAKAWEHRCTGVHSTPIRMVPRQFYSNYCYQSYAKCVRVEGVIR